MERFDMNVTVTPQAEQKIAEMCVENDMAGVRAYVYGGGCSGMQHSLTFVDIVEERDTQIVPNFYIDPVAELQKLQNLPSSKILSSNLPNSVLPI